jgi:2-desacetyl-2-hydroxyethyl bacteriochlorophyllide A dehydrogenase
MQAVRVNDGAVEVVDVPAPSGEGVRVRVHSVGICGSDLHMLRTGYPVPITLGHEMAGVTDDGSEVAIEPLAPCGECSPCKSGHYNLCAGGPGVIFGVGVDGGMAEELIVPERALVRLPRVVSTRDACVIEPLAVATHGVRRAGVRPGQRVAVIGGGAIGLCAVAAAHAAGAEVGLAARHEAQIKAGAVLGAEAIDGEYDVVVDAAGTTAALEQAVSLARVRAKVVLLGTYWEGVEMPGFMLCGKEVDIVPAMMYSRHASGRDIDVAAALLAAEPAIAEQLITHRFPLEAAAEAFRAAADRKSGAIKVVLEP